MNSFLKRAKNWCREARFGLFITACALVFVIAITIVASNQPNNDPVAGINSSSSNYIVEDSSSNSSNSSSNSSSNQPIKIEEKVLFPFTVDASIARYFFDPSDDLETRSQALVSYDNKIIPSMGVDYVYDGNQFEVKASFTGKVIAKNNDSLYGLTVIIEHENGLKSHYCGLSEVEVYQNEVINQGEVIGKSGESVINSELGSHLHFALQYDDEYLNPLKMYDKVVSSVV